MVRKKKQITNRPIEVSETGLTSKKEVIQASADAIIKANKEVRKEFRKSIFSATKEARVGNDRPASKHASVLKAFDKRMDEFKNEFNKQLEDLYVRAMNIDYKTLIQESNKISKEHKKQVISYGQGLTWAILAFSGPNHKIEPDDYARFDTLVDNITKLHKENASVVEIIGRIKQRAMVDADIQFICEMFKKHEYKETTNIDRDKVEWSATALFVHMMSPSQRYEVLLQYGKMNSTDEAAKLIDTFTKTSVITIKQREKLLSEIYHTQYRTSLDEEKGFLQDQEEIKKRYSAISKKMNSPMAINTASRFLNRHAILGGVVTAIGIAGMITNYMIAFNGEDKWYKKMTAGLVKPHFLLGAGVTAFGANMIKKNATPGESVGYWNNLLPSSTPKRNPFGMGDKAVEKNDAMKDFAEICSNHRLIERWCIDENGFAALDEFRTDQRHKKILDKTRLKLTKAEKNKYVKSDFGQLKSWLKNHDKFGYSRLIEAEKVYGKLRTRRIFTQLIGITDTLGIGVKEDFDKQGATAVSNRKQSSLRAVFDDYQGCGIRKVRKNKK